MSAAVLAALGVYILVEARDWAYYSEDGPGPGVLSGLVRRRHGRAVAGADRDHDRQGTEAAEKPDWPGISRALITWVAFAMCAALMGWLGFIISFALLTFFMITFVFRQPPVKAGIVAVGAALGFYLVFPFALSVPLPTGVFGF